MAQPAFQAGTKVTKAFSTRRLGSLHTLSLQLGDANALSANASVLAGAHWGLLKVLVEDQERGTKCGTLTLRSKPFDSILGGAVVSHMPDRCTRSSYSCSKSFSYDCNMPGIARTQGTILIVDGIIVKLLCLQALVCSAR